MLALVGIVSLLGLALCVAGVIFFAARMCLKMRSRDGRPGRFDKADMVWLSSCFSAAFVLVFVVIMLRQHMMTK